MKYWLFKSEPSVWSWEQQVQAGAKGTHWNGVRNHLAKRHMMAMKRGDFGFFYHSNEGKAIIGIVQVLREYYPDDSDPSGVFGMVDIHAVRALKRAVTLADIKAEPKLKQMSLVTSARLSVQPVLESEWHQILEMAEPGII